MAFALYHEKSSKKTQTISIYWFYLLQNYMDTLTKLK